MYLKKVPTSFSPKDENSEDEGDNVPIRKDPSKRVKKTHPIENIIGDLDE